MLVYGGRSKLSDVVTSLRIVYYAFCSLRKNRANFLSVELNFSVSNAFLRQPAISVERASYENLI